MKHRIKAAVSQALGSDEESKHELRDLKKQIDALTEMARKVAQKQDEISYELTGKIASWGASENPLSGLAADIRRQVESKRIANPSPENTEPQTVFGAVIHPRPSRWEKDALGSDVWDSAFGGRCNQRPSEERATREKSDESCSTGRPTGVSMFHTTVHRSDSGFPCKTDMFCSMLNPNFREVREEVDDPERDNGDHPVLLSRQR